MRIVTNCRPVNPRTHSLPVIVTDEHSSSNYGVPVIVTNCRECDLDLVGGENRVLDYSEVQTVRCPQSLDGRTLEPLWSGAPSTEYGDLVRWMQKMPVEIIHLPAFVQ